MESGGEGREEGQLRAGWGLERLEGEIAFFTR